MDMPKLKKKYQLYINGEWCDASNGATFESHCPADGRLLATCAQATKEDVDKAVKAAWQAWDSWKKTDANDRAEILFKIADAIDKNRKRLAEIETWDNGKPLRETMQADIPDSAEHFRYYAAAIMTEETGVRMLDENTMGIILHEPIGAVGQIIPWNFPFNMAAWKLAPVLAAGCCTVLKPATETSLSVLEFMDMIGDIVPKGVINIITGKGSEAGSYILEHPDLAKLAFTGSTEVGYTVAENAAKKLIPATLELGGKSANIVFEDADWELAMQGVMEGILFNQGQVCNAGSRVLIQDKIYDKFLKEAVERFGKVKVGLPWDDGVQMGALVSKKQMEQVLKYIDIAGKEGAKIACGGKRLEDKGLDKGFFVAPTILADVDNSMQVAQEEIFGPVACFIKFKSEDDALRIANDSEYGLAGGVFTKNINRALRVARGVRTGRMWVNSYNSNPAGAPFGGYKKSGIGRETHKMYLSAYYQVKSIMINLSEKPNDLY